MVGRQLLNPRIGSIAEDEVAGVIRRIAFLSRPLAPDDIGADFIGAVGSQEEGGGTPILYAGGWFLLSVKSGEAKIGLSRESGHFDWFLGLEIPLLVAHVPNSDDLEVEVYHTLQHSAALRNVLDDVDQVEFRCEASPLYQQDNFRIDRLDTIEVNDRKATAWLGPPLLRLSRATLRRNPFATTASSLLQETCNIHQEIRARSHVGLNTGVLWITNESIRAPVREYNLPAFVSMHREAIEELKTVLPTFANNNQALGKAIESASPLIESLLALQPPQQT